MYDLHVFFFKHIQRCISFLNNFLKQNNAQFIMVKDPSKHLLTAVYMTLYNIYYVYRTFIS